MHNDVEDPRERLLSVGPTASEFYCCFGLFSFPFFTQILSLIAVSPQQHNMSGAKEQSKWKLKYDFYGVFNLFFFFLSFFYCFAYLIGWIFVYAVFFVVVIRLRFLC